MTAPPRTARARARAELTREIKDVARRQLAEQGSSSLSLRAVARDLGMVSSAVYRYFPSRDELLTALIVDSYESIGAVAERAEAVVRRGDYAGRWLATARAVRAWAIEHPHEYALVFGSPIPGYRAPADTIDPGARIPLLLLGIVREASTAGALPAEPARPMPRSVRTDLRALREAVAPMVAEGPLAVAMMAWTQLIGSVSFELFGHLNNAVRDYPAYFDYQMRGVAESLGLRAG